MRHLIFFAVLMFTLMLAGPANAQGLEGLVEARTATSNTTGEASRAAAQAPKSCMATALELCTICNTSSEACAGASVFAVISEATQRVHASEPPAQETVISQ